jgi:hypothetical protein
VPVHGTKEGMSKKDKTPQPDTAPSAHTTTPTETWTLDSLAAVIGAPDATQRKLLFRAVTEEKLVAAGRAVDSDRIIDAVPGFVASVRAIVEKNGAVPIHGYSPKQDAIVVHETVKLRGLKQAFDAQAQQGAGSKASRRAAAREAFAAAITLRDQAYQAVVPLLTEVEQAEIDASFGTAGSAQELKRGLDAVALSVEKLIAHKEFASELEEMHLHADLARQLRERAALAVSTEQASTAATPEHRVTQRELDTQDGVVLHVIGVIYKAFKAASASHPTLVLPNLGALRSLFEHTRSVPSTPRTPVPAGSTPPAGG